MIPLFGALVATMLVGVPIAVCFGIAAIVGLLSWGNASLLILPQRMFAGIDSFPFLAIPFFILAGDLMSSAGVTSTLINFCNALVGRVRGGLAHVNVLTNVVFAGISGAATADAAAIGSVMIPMMEKAGYDRAFACAITAAASMMGPIIPPSIGMIIYSLVLGGKVSIGGLFLAGILPGLMLGGSMIGLCYFVAVRRNYPFNEEPFSIPRAARASLSATPALLAPVIILGGMIGGIFTTTEAAAVAVFYILGIGFLYTKQHTVAEVVAAIERAMVITAVVTLILATSEIFTWMMTVMRVPETLTQLVHIVAPNRTAFTIIFIVFMIIAGILIEPVPLMVMFAPILAPIAYSFGFDPLHFGLLFVLAAEIGLITPPVGTVLFVICGVGKIPLTTLSRAILPFVAVQFLVFILLAFVPSISLVIPHSLGFR